MQRTVVVGLDLENRAWLNVTILFWNSVEESGARTVFISSISRESHQ